ncbi:DUF2949 domain-containing protein [Cyanobacteria bacterium FACHB-DQ100]|nr:DUF2949 domain-containing protein [Cyanobacteria bacterium FACHB-DQ100]
MTVLLSEVNEQTQTEESDSCLVRYLKEELAVPDESIDLAMRHCEQERGTLPMVLWRYGFVSIDQLNQIFDWMER